MNGLDIVNGTYRRLRRPSQDALPWQDVLDAVRDVIARKKLDLVLAEQNNAAVTSEWFTPTGTDTILTSTIPILLPIALETRAIGSGQESGDQVPIVNYEVLNTTGAGTAAFYGNPLRLVLQDSAETVAAREYRLIYEADFSDDFTIDPETGTAPALAGAVALPSFVKQMIEIEAAWDLIDEVNDETPEWIGFKNSKMQKWPLDLMGLNEQWKEYVRKFRGRAQVPKRGLFQNIGMPYRTKWFKG